MLCSPVTPPAPIPGVWFWSFLHHGGPRGRLAAGQSNEAFACSVQGPPSIMPVSLV